MGINRRHIRSKVFQALYAYELSDTPMKDTFDQLLKEYYVKVYRQEQKKGLEGDAAYLHKLFYKTIERREEFEQMIYDQLQNWSIERVALADRIFIMMGLTELLHCSEIPVKVTLNEYIELAYLYSTDQSNSFVNGILDALYKQLNAQEAIHKAGLGLVDYPTQQEARQRPASTT
jgi:transcription antitermination factor NusB